MEGTKGGCPSSGNPAMKVTLDVELWVYREEGGMLLLAPPTWVMRTPEGPVGAPGVCDPPPWKVLRKGTKIEILLS